MTVSSARQAIWSHFLFCTMSWCAMIWMMDGSLARAIILPGHTMCLRSELFLLWTYFGDNMFQRIQRTKQQLLSVISKISKHIISFKDRGDRPLDLTRRTKIFKSKRKGKQLLLNAFSSVLQSKCTNDRTSSVRSASPHPALSFQFFLCKYAPISQTKTYCVCVWWSASHDASSTSSFCIHIH